MPKNYAAAIVQSVERRVCDRKVAGPGSIPELAMSRCVHERHNCSIFLIEASEFTHCGGSA